MSDILLRLSFPRASSIFRRGRAAQLSARSITALIGVCWPVSVGLGGDRSTLTSPRKPERIAAVVESARTRICWPAYSMV